MIHRETAIAVRHPPPETKLGIKDLLPSPRFCGLDPSRIDVHPDAGRAGFKGHAAGDAAGSTRDFQRSLSGTDREKAKPFACFSQHEPASLPEIFVVRLAAHRQLGIGTQVTVVSVVDIRLRQASENPRVDA